MRTSYLLAGSFSALAALGALAASLTLSGCSTTSILPVYRVDIPQGRPLTPEQVAQVRPGLSQQEVAALLGEPPLVDLFHADRWDYPYYLRAANGEQTRRSLTVFFVGGRVERVTTSPELTPGTGSP